MNALPLDQDRTFVALVGLSLAGLHSASAHTQAEAQVEAWSAAWPIELAVLNGVEAE